MCEEAYVMQHLFLITVFSLDNKTSAMYSFTFLHLIPGWLVWAEIKYMVPTSLSKQPLNWFQPVRQTKPQELTVKIYTHCVANCISTPTYIIYIIRLHVCSAILCFSWTFLLTFI
jgi:hypothetical protein